MVEARTLPGEHQHDPSERLWFGVLSRRAHRAKTFGGFQLTQLSPGVFHWVTPHGWEFMVGPLGTEKITSPARRRPPAEPPSELEDSWRVIPEPIPDSPPPPESVAWPIVQHTLFEPAA